MHFTYCCRVHPSLRGTTDADAFERAVTHVLSDPRGWARAGVIFTAVLSASDVVVELVPNCTARNLGQRFDGMSVTDCSRAHVYINASRWAAGAKRGGAPDPAHTMLLSRYRAYVINHEFGHILLGCTADDHVPKGACVSGGDASVMMQQTNGVGRQCRPNPWPGQSEVARVREALARKLI